MKRRSLENGLRNARVLVCAGTGGVGKTTIAAALAIQAARLGRRTLVLTIDPARRLADALGLESLGASPTPVDLLGLVHHIHDTRPSEPESDQTIGTLDAMMLDPKPTFDRLITRLTSTESERRRILDNRIYEHLSSALAGSAEYAAMEQVHELVHSGRYDLIVVDTPPADHALDFLRAPRRLRDFLESRFVLALVRPAMSASRFGFRIFGRPLHRMLSLLERIAGVGFLDDLSEFLSAIDGLSSGFRERATRVEEILLGEETGFVLIASAQGGGDASALEFMAELEEFQVPLIAVIVNRLRPWPLDKSPKEFRAHCRGEALARDQALLNETWESQSPATASRSKGGSDSNFDASVLTAAVLEYAEICEIEHECVATLTTLAAETQLRCHTVPELSGGLDQLPGLIEIGSVLLSQSSES